MIQDILARENVRIIDGITDWREAIIVSGAPLLEQNYIVQQYIDTIIDLTEKNGAYYLLTPSIALVHARPENGVIKTQLAVTLLREPVFFDGKTIATKLFITLAATDSQSHLDSLSQIAELLSSEITIQKLLEAEDSDTLYNLIMSDEFVVSD